jgi:hypothetical protein
VSELHDRLTALAERGTPRGADAVLDTAARKATLGVIEGERDDDDLDPIPFVTTEPEPARHARRRFGSMITAAGIATMLLVGMLAISSLVGSGGANSPEAAVRRLAEAMSHEDPLEAADVLSPTEVRSLHETLDAAEKKAAELRLVEAASAPLSGVDFSVDDVRLTTTALADGFAKVTIESGTLSASTQKSRFSPLMQKALGDAEDNSATIDLARLGEDQNLPTFVVVVREEGHWYVSAAYTALEYVRVYNTLPGANFGSGERAAATLGADSPDAAVQDAMRALQRSDWTTLMTLVRPDELPVYDYRDALLALAQRDEWKTTFTIDQLSTTSEMHGDTAKVTLHASGTTDSGHWSVDGGCFTGPPAFDAPSAGYVYCLPKAPVDIFDVFGSTSPATADGPSQITAVQRDGRWFVSPVGTALDVLNTWIRNIDRRGLYSLLHLPTALEPDGEIRLGEPVTVPGGVRGMHVFTLTGHQGERVIGLVKPSLNSEFVSESEEIIAPDGNSLGGFYGEAITLPADGIYRIAVFNYRGVDQTVTVWNKTDAPAEARSSPSSGGCVIDVFVSQCGSKSSSATTTPTTATKSTTATSRP